MARSPGYGYKDMRKDIFVDGHERSDVVEDRKNFLTRMAEIKSYMIAFEKNGIIKIRFISLTS